MRYMGGKHRQAKRIVECLPAGDVYVEPFLGGASVAALAAPLFPKAILADYNADLVALWQGAVSGEWAPQSEPLTPEQYAHLKAGGGSAADRAFAATCMSFGGKWFGGYACPIRNRTDYQGQGVRGIARKAAQLREASDLTIVHSDYESMRAIGPGTVVYCDPPYADTVGYAGASKDTFDSERFWSTAAMWADSGASVYVSEYIAPSGWEVVAEMSRQGTLKQKHGESDRVTEKLYTRSQPTNKEMEV